MYKNIEALNDLQWSICHITKPKQNPFGVPQILSNKLNPAEQV